MPVPLNISLIADGVRSIVATFRAGFEWWVGELLSLVPARLKAFFAGDAQRLCVRIEKDFVLIESWDAANRWRLARSSPPEIPQTLQALLRDGATAVLLLSKELVLRRTIEMPLAAASELHAATSFLIDRFTPFRPDQTYYAVRLLSRDKGRKLLQAKLAVVPRERLDSSVEVLASFGIHVSAVRIDGEDGGALDLTPRRIRGALAGMREAWKPVLAVGLALLVAGPPVVAYRAHIETQALMSAVSAVEVPGRRAAELRSEIEAPAVSQAFLPAHRRSSRTIEILDSVSRSLPDNTWLFAMELRPGQATLSGFSSDVPAVLERLTRDIFATAELTSPVTHGLMNGKDRFELRVQIKASQS